MDMWNVDVTSMPEPGVADERLLSLQLGLGAGRLRALVDLLSHRHQRLVHRLLQSVTSHTSC